LGVNALYSNSNDTGIGREMVTFVYKGEGERVFPSIGVTVKPGDNFEAPSDFTAPDVLQVKTLKATPAVTKENEE
jgi:hypothetical protein